MKICPYCEKEMTTEYCCGEVGHGVDKDEWEAHEVYQERLYWARQELREEERERDDD